MTGNKSLASLKLALGVIFAVLIVSICIFATKGEVKDIESKVLVNEEKICEIKDDQKQLIRDIKSQDKMTQKKLDKLLER